MKARKEVTMMSPVLVALCYGSAMVVSLFLVWHFGAKRWYLHGLSIAAALAIGSIPLSGPWGTPSGTLAVGWVFILLMMWGVGGALYAIAHYGGRPHKEHWHWPGRFHFRHH
jgi:hypothetical protein